VDYDRGPLELIPDSAFPVAIARRDFEALAAHEAAQLEAAALGMLGSASRVIEALGSSTHGLEGHDLGAAGGGLEALRQDTDAPIAAIAGGAAALELELGSLTGELNVPNPDAPAPSPPGGPGDDDRGKRPRPPRPEPPERPGPGEPPAPPPEEDERQGARRLAIAKITAAYRQYLNRDPDADELRDVDVLYERHGDYQWVDDYIITNIKSRA
jgi:hypothetical protein